MKNYKLKGDETLSVRNDHLFVEECDATKLAEEFGTPIYVMSEKQLRANIRHFIAAFQSRWPEGKVKILPAVKANWNLTLRRILTEEGAGCDVYAPGELHAALSSGTEPGFISVNGGGKSPEFLRQCVRAGVRITIDDVDELDLVNEAAIELNMKARIRLRLRPDLPHAWEPTDFAIEVCPIDIGFQVYKNGLPTEHVIEMGKRALKMPNIELMGFHVHLGRQHSKLSVWRHTMERYAILIAKLKEEWGGYEPKEIDVGGGIPTPRDPFRKMHNRADNFLFPALWAFMGFLTIFGEKIRYKVIDATVGLIHKTPNKKLVPEIEEYAQVITDTLRKVLTKHKVNIKGLMLQVEPGRSMYGNTGVHLTKVLKTKHQTKPVTWNWVLLDTTYFFMAGAALEYTMNDFVIANKVGAPNEITADIVGRSCFADRILPEVKIPKLVPGDLIAALDAGAYHEVSASNFNALPRPATILVNGDRADIIRRAETVADVFARDVIPERFAFEKSRAPAVDSELHRGTHAVH